MDFMLRKLETEAEACSGCGDYWREVVALQWGEIGEEEETLYSFFIFIFFGINSLIIIIIIICNFTNTYVAFIFILKKNCTRGVLVT